jgi:hypothetical protein
MAFNLKRLHQLTKSRNGKEKGPQGNTLQVKERVSMHIGSPFCFSFNSVGFFGHLNKKLVRQTPSEKRFLVPTSLGEKIVSGLCGHFSFVEYDFTRTMEQSLDDIAEGKVDYRAVMASAYDRLSKEVREFAKATGKVCEKCGKSMVRRVKKPGKDGKGGYDFWGCTGWPECKEVL